MDYIKKVLPYLPLEELKKLLTGIVPDGWMASGKILA